MSIKLLFVHPHHADSRTLCDLLQQMECDQNKCQVPYHFAAGFFRWWRVTGGG